ncbi:MAG: hypothetical protein M9891_01610 [Austwickia sp.]|nr:hypothetical protein [Austwickia sp.]
MSILPAPASAPDVLQNLTAGLLDPLAELRRGAAAEAVAAAAGLAAAATDLDAVRSRVAAALAAVRWHSAAAEAGRREGAELVAALAGAVADCRTAAAALRDMAAGTGAR